MFGYISVPKDVPAHVGLHDTTLHAAMLLRSVPLRLRVCRRDFLAQ